MHFVLIWAWDIPLTLSQTAVKAAVPVKTPPAKPAATAKSSSEESSSDEEDAPPTKKAKTGITAFLSHWSWRCTKKQVLLTNNQYYSDLGLYTNNFTMGAAFTRSCELYVTLNCFSGPYDYIWFIESYSIFEHLSKNFSAPYMRQKCFWKRRQMWN